MCGAGKHNPGIPNIPLSISPHPLSNPHRPLHRILPKPQADAVHGLVEAGLFGGVFKQVELLGAANEVAEAYADPDAADLTEILDNPLLQEEERLRIQAFFAGI